MINSIKNGSFSVMARAVCLLASTLLLFACAGPEYAEYPASTGGVTGSTSATIAPLTSVAMNLTLSATTVDPGKSVTVTASLLDATGNAVANGTAVQFALNNSSMGSVTASSVTAAGKAQSMFTASTLPGVVSIIASVTGGTSTNPTTISGTIDININDAVNSSTVTLAVSASTVSVGGTATITATVKDAAGALVPDGTSVKFLIDDSTLGNVTTTVATVGGKAIATFTASSSKAGVANIVASSGTASATASVTVNNPNSPATVTVSANPSAVSGGGTSTVTAKVYTSAGNFVPDGTTVTFTLTGNSASDTISASATTTLGVATATFTASTTPGTVTVTATSGGKTATATVVISNPSSGAIGFLSSAPQIIGVKGAGQTEVATLKFWVKDVNGNSVVDGTNIDFCLTGPSGGTLPANGGEYLNMVTVKETFTDANGNGCYDTGEAYADGNLNSAFDSPLHATAKTLGGVASVLLHSGAVAGNATVKATVTGSSPLLSSSSSVVSIGGGVASAKHMTVVMGQEDTGTGIIYSNYDLMRNCAPDYPAFPSNCWTSIYVMAADRFGNGNVLTGSSVSYYTEAGATESSSTLLDSKGSTSVVFRSQLPFPSTAASAQAWETTYLAGLNTRFGTSTTAYPRSDWATILVTMNGEEDFTDTNQNGQRDAGEAFDDLGEPYLDANDSGAYDAGEFFVDENGNGSYTAPNGAWDGSKLIFKNVPVRFTYDNGGSMVVATNTHINSISSIAVPGSGYTVNDVLTIAGGSGGTAKVTAVDGGGGVTAVTLTNGGDGYTAGAKSVTGGTGTLCQLTVTVTGFSTFPQSITVGNGSSVYYEVLVGDVNLNQLPRGSTVTISVANSTLANSGTATNVATLLGTTSYTFPYMPQPSSTTGLAPVIGFTVTDGASGTTANNNFTITIKVTVGSFTYSYNINGTSQ